MIACSFNAMKHNWVPPEMLGHTLEQFGIQNYVNGAHKSWPMEVPHSCGMLRYGIAAAI